MLKSLFTAVIRFFDITRNRCLECERTLPAGQLMCAGCNRGALRFMTNLAIIAFTLTSGAYGQQIAPNLVEPFASRATNGDPVMKDGNSRVILISEEEAARLAKLRQAVVDAEKEIATAHGVDVNGDTNPCLESTTWCRVYSAWMPRGPETFRFSGRFLLVGDVAKESGK